MITLGLLLLVAAALVTIVGVAANTGSGHSIQDNFNLFGYHPNGSTGQLLLIGVIIGAVGMLGLTMLLAGLGRGFSKRITSRRDLKQTRREAGSLHTERDQLARQLEQERAARTQAEAARAGTTEPYPPGLPAAAAGPPAERPSILHRAFGR